MDTLFDDDIPLEEWNREVLDREKSDICEKSPTLDWAIKTNDETMHNERWLTTFHPKFQNLPQPLTGHIMTIKDVLSWVDRIAKECN